MGVPLVTLYGDRHAARRGGMLLRNLRLDQMIALTPDQYIEIATDLGRDRDRLVELRSGMRRRVAQSPLVDGPRFIVHLEAAYRGMWRAYCGEAP
jgi:predicted O-linked N-acetylglucosamine transferase (SPINDLY family)